MNADLRSQHYSEVLPTLSGNRQKIYDALVMIGEPCTPKELATKINWDKCSTRPRMTELRQMGLIAETGERRGGEHVFRAILTPEPELNFNPVLS